MTKKSPVHPMKTAKKKKIRSSHESGNPAGQTPERPLEASAKDLKRLAHALGLHRLELEKQNEELRRAEEALRRSEERFRVAQELSLDAFTILDAVRDERGAIVDFRWVYVNPKAGQILRRAPEELTGQRLLAVLPGNKTNSDLFDRYVHVVETGEPNDYEVCYQAEGIDGWFRNMTVKLGDGIAIYFNDITERKRTEEALRESELRLSALINAADESILLFGLDGTVLSANTTAARRIGMSVDVILGRKAVDLIPASLAKSRQKRVNEVIRTRKPVYFEDERAEIIFEHSIYPVQDKTGAISAIAVFSRDITERRRAEEELRTTHAKLAQHAYELATVNRELESFSYTVSHDLKAPLRSIDGFARALQEEYADNLDATGRDYLLRVISACRRMNQLIEAMLNMARLTSGELQEKTVDLSSLAMIIVHDLRKQQPGRQVEFIIADNIKVNGDVTMLQVLLENLFHNAWKFTGKQARARIEFGSVTMDDRTVFFVRDNGAGFDMQYADTLFMPFNRFHAASEFPGIGIGLAIAHRIVRRHNGRLWAESAPEQGATFYFTL